MMRKLAIALLVFLLSFPLAFADTPVTEAEARAFLAKMTGLIAQRKYTALMPLIADDAVLTIEAGTHILDLTKPQYAALLESSHPMVQDYQYQADIDFVEMVPTGAMVRMTVRQQATVQSEGQSMAVTAESRESLQLEKRDGELKLSMLHSRPLKEAILQDQE